jgi:catechol 2,3-dioxygenase-like lactoylglutathione lyase family enzyme
MLTRIAHVAYLVRDYDEAIRWFVDVLGFELLEDTAREPGKRWVRVAPPGGGTELLLARAATPEQQAAIGHQGGGRVAWFLYTDDFDADHARMSAAGIRFLESPRREPYGTVAVFEDLNGMKWDLLQRTTP